jgi:RIO kinase 2
VLPRPTVSERLGCVNTFSCVTCVGVRQIVTTLLRYKLISHDRKQYDGYRLGYPGYDYLALNTLRARGHISAVGMQIGVGKESDIFLVSNDAKEQFVLKLHRLGRISFRNIKAVRVAI